MRGWSIRNCPTLCSFGVKLLLLAGTLGVLFLSGLLQGPSQSTQSEASFARQAGTVPERLPEPLSVTVPDPGHVDINRGSVEELQRLPGIGPILAARVVRYRRENGTFATVRDMQQVKGIGVKRFAQLEPYIYVHPKSPSAGE